jgi:hypothetical protein
MSVTVSLGSIRDNARHRPGTPHILNWELHNGDGCRPYKFSFSCDNLPTISAFRRQLDSARHAGLVFDPKTGLPAGVVRPPTRGQGGQPGTAETEASLADAGPGIDRRPVLFAAAERLHRHWVTRPPNTTRSDVDALVMAFAAMIRPDALALDAAGRGQLRRWIREVLTPGRIRARLAQQKADDDLARHGARTPAEQLTPAQRHRRARTERAREQRRQARREQDERAGRYYAAHGLGWAEFDEAAALALVSRLRHLVDGRRADHNTTARRLITANELFDWGARRPEIPLKANPIRLLDRQDRPGTGIKIRPVELRLVVGISVLIDIVQTCRRLGADGDQGAARLVAFFALMCFGAPRPSEARLVVGADLIDLPRGSWGTVELHDSITSPGRRFTPNGDTEHKGGLKHRPPGSTRVVPLAPFLVDALADHLQQFPTGPHDPLFRDATGALITTAEIGRVWKAIKKQVFAQQPELRKSLRLYDLRHARFSHWLAAGVLPRAVIAAWGGNSVGTLESTYEGVISAGSRPWARDLEMYLDEVVPPEYQRRQSDHDVVQSRLIRDLALKVAGGDVAALPALLEVLEGHPPGSRTVQACQSPTPESR